MTMRPFFRALIPAGLLAALVLFVFSTLQYYGPESAVRRFHEALKYDDPELLEEVVVPPTNPREAQEIAAMRNLLSPILARGARFRLRNKAKDRRPGKVTILVEYTLAGRTRNGPFVAKRDSLGWKVDIHESWQAWNKMFRPTANPQVDTISGS